MADVLYLIGGSGGGGSGGGIASYANFASLPGSGSTGDVAITIDTGVVYWWDGAAWEPIDTELASVAVTDTNSIDHTITGGVLSSDLRLSSDGASAGNFKATATVKSGGSPGLHVEAPEATGSQTGFLKSADWTTFNNKVSTTRSISTTAPLAGGGDLSADRTLSIPAATSGQDGYLTSTDWSTFNGKAPSTRNINTTAPLAGGGDLSADRTLSIPQANGSTDGFLDSADWTTFNNKEPAITAATTSDYYRGDKTFQPLNVAALSAVTDGSSSASGKIGEILSGTQATNTTTGVGASGAYGNVTSVSLTPGVWSIEGVVGFNENGAVLTDSLVCGISASATGSGISEFDTTQHSYLISGSADAIFKTPRVLISIGSATTYYLNTKFNYSSGTPRHRGRIQALRIR